MGGRENGGCPKKKTMKKKNKNSPAADPPNDLLPIVVVAVTLVDAHLRVRARACAHGSRNPPIPARRQHGCEKAESDRDAADAFDSNGNGNGNGNVRAGRRRVVI